MRRQECKKHVLHRGTNPRNDMPVHTLSNTHRCNKKRVTRRRGPTGQRHLYRLLLSCLFSRPIFDFIVVPPETPSLSPAPSRLKPRIPPRCSPDILALSLYSIDHCMTHTVNIKTPAVQSVWYHPMSPFFFFRTQGGTQIGTPLEVA